MSHKRPTGYLGGDVSMDERHKLIARHLKHKSGIDFSYRFMCRCGSTWRVRYRNVWYCNRCGRWTRDWVVRTRLESMKESNIPATRVWAAHFDPWGMLNVKEVM